MYAYFIGHPDDVDQGFWDKNDSTITKMSKDCWIKPTPLRYQEAVNKVQKKLSE